MLTFEPEEHRYFVDGREVPSVTKILEPYSCLEFVDKELLKRASEFGTNVHTACHLHDCGELDRAALDPELEPYLAGWEQFLADTGATVVLSEYRVASAYGYAGTFDKLVAWGKSLRLIDIKSGSVVPRTVGPQVAAYVQAYAEESGAKIRDRYCLHLPGDGKYHAHKLNDARDWSIFQSALNVHRWFYNGRKS